MDIAVMLKEIQVAPGFFLEIMRLKSNHFSINIEKQERSYLCSAYCVVPRRIAGHCPCQLRHTPPVVTARQTEGQTCSGFVQP